MNTTNYPSEQPVRRSTTVWPAVLGVGILALGGVAVYQGMQTQELRRELVAAKQDSTTLRGQLNASGADMADEIKALKASMAQELNATRSNVDQFRTTAFRHADTLAKKQAEQAQQLAAQLGEVKESGAQIATKVDGITTAVGTTQEELNAAKTELAGAKTEITDTKNDLQRVRGDLGMVGGLVATNSKDIQFLRQLGDRNIYEFNIAKSSGMQKIGDIQMALKKTDAKRNKFTVDLLADDKLIQKKDKNTNEPVQFYTSKAKQVYEVVVNRVDKDRITGYLATPKVTLSRN